VAELPPACPACGLITNSKEKYDAHVRLHDYMRGLAT
jgi:uncharacterized C2H2 Zn-finger protein